MMRNVALGAVLGFALVVALLSVFGKDAPPVPPAPSAAVPPVQDAGLALRMLPVGVHPARLMVEGAAVAPPKTLARRLGPDAGPENLGP
jgi:hypothetical protein